MTIGVDPLYGYGSGAAAASSMCASNPIMALSQDASTMAQPMLDAYAAQLAAAEQQSSIFGGDYMTDGSINPATLDATSAYRQMRELQEEQMNYNMRQAEQYRLNQAQVSAQYNNMNFAAQALQTKILEDEQAQIYPALMAFVEAYKTACDPDGTMDEKTLLASACAEYQKITGNNLLADIKANSSGSFMNGFIRSATFGLFGQKQSADETIAQITGQEVSESSQNWKRVGKVSGKTASCAAIGAGIGACFGGIGAGPGAAIGAVVGFVWGLFD